MKKIIFRCLAVLCILALLPATVAFADDLEVNISSDPDDITYIPLGDMDQETLTINGVHFQPDIAPGNLIEVQGGDFLAAILLTEDTEFFGELNSDMGTEMNKSDVYIRLGNIYADPDSPAADTVTEESLKEATEQSRDKLIDRKLNEIEPELHAFNFKYTMYSDAQAMKLLLEGSSFSIEANGKNMTNIGIGNVWEGPVPDKDYDMYVPPYIPPAPEPEPELGGVPGPEPEPDPDDVAVSADSATPAAGELAIEADYGGRVLSLTPTINTADAGKWWYTLATNWTEFTETLLLVFTGTLDRPADAQEIADGGTVSIGYGAENDVTATEAITVNNATPTLSTAAADGGSEVTLTKEPNAVGSQDYQDSSEPPTSISTVDDPATTDIQENVEVLAPGTALVPTDEVIVTDSGDSTQIDVYDPVAVPVGLDG